MNRREGPLFNENFLFKGKICRLQGGLESVAVFNDKGDQIATGRVDLIPTSEAGRLTRTLVFVPRGAADKEFYIVAENGLTAGKEGL